ncbi:MAG: hypothetical protein AAGK32_15110, partial [Actinomycetota bacterium]
MTGPERGDTSLTDHSPLVSSMGPLGMDAVGGGVPPPVVPGCAVVAGAPPPLGRAVVTVVGLGRDVVAVVGVVAPRRVVAVVPPLGFPPLAGRLVVAVRGRVVAGEPPPLAGRLVVAGADALVVGVDDRGVVVLVVAPPAGATESGVPVEGVEVAGCPVVAPPPEPGSEPMTRPP